MPRSPKASASSDGASADSRPLELRTAAEAVADLIREAILDGRFAPGERLKEERLADAFGTSRTPIREALLILQTEGALVATPNRGSVVRAYSVGEIDDVYATRAVLEAHAAHRAAERRADAPIAGLSDSCRRFARLLDGSDIGPLVAENFRFHAIVQDASGSASLASLIRSVTRLPLIYRSYYWYSSNEKLVAMHYHERITRAIEEREPARAAALMREHVLQSRDVLVARLARRDGGRGAGPLQQRPSR
jgi:DNA-binding GntR family transcriptional regulator